MATVKLKVMEKAFIGRSMVKDGEIITVDAEYYRAALAEGINEESNRPMSGLVNHCVPKDGPKDCLEGYLKLMEKTSKKVPDKTEAAINRVLKKEGKETAEDNKALGDPDELETLMAQAKELKIRGYKKMSIDELKEAIKEAGG